MFNSFVEYGRRLMALVDQINVDLNIARERKRAPLMAAASYESIARS
jgi:hypothetical protein